MKNLFKATTSLAAALLVFAACTTTPQGKIVGTVNGNNIVINHYEDIFKEETAEESTENNTMENKTPESEEVVYDESTAMLMSVFTEIFNTTGNGTIDKKKLNTALNNLKGKYGDKYLEEAEKNYQLPIKTEKDLIAVLSFSILYSGYIEKSADISNATISELYLKSYKTKYCASHILVENEADAKILLDKIATGEKTFADYTAEAKTIFDSQNTNAANASKTLNVNEVTISGVKVKQFADLDCAPASNYVGEFGVALEQMEKGTVSTAPVKTDFGYHIIDLRDIEETELTKEVQDTIKSKLLQEKTQIPGFSSYYLKQLVEQVTVDITDEKVKELYDDYVEKLTTEAAKYNPETEESTTNNN